MGKQLDLELFRLRSNSHSTKRHKSWYVLVERKDKAYLEGIEDVDALLELVELCKSEQADADSVSRFPN
jgi:hypothetical protein